MKRIDTSTVDEDLYGTGRDGFTNGDPGIPTPPTQLDDSWFNNVQEELARCVEGSGETLDETDLHQVDDAVEMAAVRGVMVDATASYVLRGLTFDLTGTSLTVPLSAGEFVYNGRRYVITAAKLAAAAANSFLLTASRDTYFYFAPADPGGASPNDRETVYVVASAVANGAAAPGTPAGTVLFAMVVTNGTDATAVTYYNRGPTIAAESAAGSAGIRLRPVVGSEATRAALIPTNLAVDLGAGSPSSVVEGFDHVYCRQLHIRTAASALHDSFDCFEYTSIQATSAATVANVNILDASLYPDGSCAYVEVRAVAIDPSDPTDAYSGRIECHAHIDGGGVWQLDGSGSAPQFEDGDGALAAGVTLSFNTSGSQLRIGLQPHSTDALRWILKVNVLVTGD